MTSLSPDVLITGLLAVAIVAGLALAIEPWLSPWLLRSRAQRLPPDLAERLGEEWLGELDALDTRTLRLMFAVSLFLTSTKRFLGEGESVTAPAGSPQVLLSNDVQVTADIWSRAPALLIDAVISVPIALVLNRWLLNEWVPAATGRNVWVVAAIGLCRLILVVVCVRRFGGTPGKLLMKLRIVTTEAAPVSYRHAILRIAPSAALGFASLFIEHWQLSLLRLPFVLIANVWSFGDLLVYAGSLDHRAWHDLIAGTMVIYKVPKVVGSLNISPPRATSPMR